MRRNKDKQKEEILEFLKKGEKTASEIAIYTKINFYKINNLLAELIKENEIMVFDFRKNKYYKFKK